MSDQGAEPSSFGSVPAVRRPGRGPRRGEDAEYLQWVYSSIQEAPAFTQSWDQALDRDLRAAR